MVEAFLCPKKRRRIRRLQERARKEEQGSSKNDRKKLEHLDFVLFLDVDGVLHPAAAQSTPTDHFAKENMVQLRRLLAILSDSPVFGHVKTESSSEEQSAPEQVLDEVS